jgi:hypothetical protein
MASVEWLTAVIGLIGAALGAALSMAATTSVEKRRIAAEKRARWDTMLLELSRDMASAARGASHYASTAFEHPEERVELMSGAMQRVRAVSEQIRLVAGKDVQSAARLVRKRTWHVLRSAVPDPAAVNGTGSGTGAARAATAALDDALQAYYLAVRLQLGVPSPYDVIHDDE